ncbi:MAG: hypothetical protein ACLRX5_02790 [Slackia sp.]
MKHRVSLIGVFACAVCLVMTLAGCSQSTAYTPETLNPTVSSPTTVKTTCCASASVRRAVLRFDEFEQCGVGSRRRYGRCLADQLGLA